MNDFEVNPVGTMAKLEEMEAKLAKALLALQEIKFDIENDEYNIAYLVCKYILPKLKGDGDG